MKKSRHYLRKLLLYFGILIGLMALGAVILTLHVYHNRYQTEFLTGTVPQDLNGFYQGTPLFLINTKVDWRGKRFDAKTGRGDNLSIDTYGNPFLFYISKAVGDDREVIKLDYDLPENPFYVRMIRDEIVQVGPSEYLGKLQIRLLPKVLIGIGYFRLQRAQSTSNGCVISGCSKELCGDIELFSVCNFKPEYTCYRTARCERQKTGKCEWTKTAELAQCFNKEKNNQ